MHAMIRRSAASVYPEPIGVPGLFLARSLSRSLAISQRCCLDAVVWLSHHLFRCLDALTFQFQVCAARCSSRIQN